MIHIFLMRHPLKIAVMVVRFAQIYVVDVRLPTRVLDECRRYKSVNQVIGTLSADLKAHIEISAFISLERESPPQTVTEYGAMVGYAVDILESWDARPSFSAISRPFGAQVAANDNRLAGGAGLGGSAAGRSRAREEDCAESVH